MQGTIEGLTERLTSRRISCHVIVTAHTTVFGPEVKGLMTEDEDDAHARDKLDDSLRAALAEQVRLQPVRFVPRTIGRALSPGYAEHFSTVILYRTNEKGERIIRTAPEPGYDLKVPDGTVALPPELPVATGLLDVLEAVSKVRT